MRSTRKQPSKRFASFYDCKTFGDYYDYMRQRGYPTPIPHEHIEKDRKEAYDRILKTDTVRKRKGHVMLDEIQQGKRCPYCHDKSQYMDSAPFYGGNSYGMVWACVKCEAYVGVHQGTDKPLGRLANKELRLAKKEAHKYFDQLWKRKMKATKQKQGKCRGEAYSWLALQLKIASADCHIGMFDVDQCRKVIELCKPYYR